MVVNFISAKVIKLNIEYRTESDRNDGANKIELYLSPYETKQESCYLYFYHRVNRLHGNWYYSAGNSKYYQRGGTC